MPPPLLKPLAFTLFFAFNSIAAENPSEPSQGKSSGKFRITLFNQTLIQIYGLRDVDIINDGGLIGNLTGTTPVCVASNVSHYRIAMASSKGFTLEQGENSIDYTLSLKHRGDPINEAIWGNGNGHLKSGAYATKDIERDETLSGPTPVQTDCDGTAHQIEASVQSADIPDNSTGAFTDVVTVTVAPI